MAISQPLQHLYTDRIPVHYGPDRGPSSNLPPRLIRHPWISRFCLSLPSLYAFFPRRPTPSDLWSYPRRGWSRRTECHREKWEWHKPSSIPNCECRFAICYPKNCDREGYCTIMCMLVQCWKPLVRILSSDHMPLSYPFQHSGSYILGPLKSRLSRELGTSHSEFSLLLSAYSLNSTWTPLIGGLLAARLGTTITSILATGILLLGQILLLIGNIIGSIRLMVWDPLTCLSSPNIYQFQTLGMFVFGLGVSPLAVIQETIIVRFFKSHGKLLLASGFNILTNVN
jgi:hypothetical protein